MSSFAPRFNRSVRIPVGANSEAEKFVSAPLRVNVVYEDMKIKHNQ